MVASNGVDMSELGPPDIGLWRLRIWVHDYQFDDPDNVDDAEWLTVTAYCEDDGCAARAYGSFLCRSELAQFLAECETLQETLAGRAELRCMEEQLAVKLVVSDSRGGIEAEVYLSPDPLTQDHTFRFSIDQSYLPELIAGLRDVLSRYPARDGPE